MRSITDHVFISFAQHDLVLATKLAGALNERDVPAWIASEKLIAGTADWESTIRDAIERSFSVVFLASPHAAKSLYVRGELALSETKGKTIIPVWVSGLAWPDCVPLGSVFSQRIDLREGRSSEAFDKLVERLKELLAGQWLRRAIAATNVYEKVSFYTEVIRINPNDPAGYYNRGVARFRTGDVEAMIEDFTEAIRLKPNYADAFQRRGNAYVDMSARYDDRRNRELKGLAFDDYTAAIKNDPHHAKAFHNRGLIRAELGDPDLALRDYDSAIRLDPSFGRAYHNRALIRGAKGDLAGAQQDRNTAAHLGFSPHSDDD